MPYEIGGRADKMGNRYENRWVVYQLLRVIDESLVSLEIEAIGEDEKGIDVWITYPNGIREGQQCKGRNASKEIWDISSLKAKDILCNWKKQLDRNYIYEVSLVTPLTCSKLVDLIDRAHNSNGNPEDFLNYQIGDSGKEFVQFFKDFCIEMQLNYGDINDIRKLINYLQRINFRQVPDTFLREMVDNKIQLLFLGDVTGTYDCLNRLLQDENIYSVCLTTSYLRHYLRENNIAFRDLVHDPKVASRIMELNEEFKEQYQLISNSLLYRNEFEICIDAIRSGSSICIHGKAGSGKSGCTHAIMNYCESNGFPYLAIKLDKKVPNGSAEKWGIDLALPASIVHCLHSIARNENAVIILDQLDALRWTQVHSRDALDICSEIIRQVNNINIERIKKISLVLVCRTYDLENDNHIRNLFEKHSDIGKSMHWLKIQVMELPADLVISIVGDRYQNLSSKLKKILCIPSNLYIWQMLDPSKVYNEYTTANELISEWWRQLCERSYIDGVDERILQDLKEKFVLLLERNNVYAIEERVLQTTRLGQNYLASNGFIIMFNHMVSFSHQSIFDYFIVEQMLRRYYEKESVINIIGTREHQTPIKRYQVQMFLQGIIEKSIDEFINIGRQIIDSSIVRFYIKYVVFEVLSQFETINASVEQFIIDYLKVDRFENHIIHCVINGHTAFFDLLIDTGLLDIWMLDTKKKVIAINLLKSLKPKLNAKQFAFLKSHLFISSKDDEMLYYCFNFNVSEDTDEMFNLRMEYFERYPEQIGLHINIIELFKKCEMRAILIVECMLRHKVKSQGKNMFRYEEEFLDQYSDVIVSNGIFIVDYLVPHVPEEKDYYSICGDWDGRYTYNTGLERACISILKKANAAIINIDPEIFMNKYGYFFGKGYIVFNEIILSALELFPEKYSDFIIQYIANNLDGNVIDKTSGRKDELELIKNVIRKHSSYCTRESLELLEQKIVTHHDTQATENYKWLIDNEKKQEKRNVVIYSFWGEFQLALLQSLTKKSLKTCELIKVLERKYDKNQNRYSRPVSYCGAVKSTIEGKKLSDKKWVELLRNKKLDKEDRSKWIEANGIFLESSIRQFSTDFHNAVSAEPERFIRLVKSINDPINEAFIDSLLAGIADCSELCNISLEVLEEMILMYGCNNESNRARYICRIIEKRCDDNWSQDVIDVIKNIALTHKNPELGKVNVTNLNDKEMKTYEMLYSNSYNCVRGSAARTIGSLLWNNRGLFSQFKETISALCMDSNPAVRLANLNALYPVYNIDREWSTNKFIDTFESDYRFAGHHIAKDLLIRMYDENKDRIRNIMINCYNSDDEHLIKTGSYCIAEIFILKDEFKEMIFDVDNIKEVQAQSIIEMMLLYYNTDVYGQKVKDTIGIYANCKYDLSSPLSWLFNGGLINLDRDNILINQIMQSLAGKKIIYTFVRYLKTNSLSVFKYKAIIIDVSRLMLEKLEDEDLTDSYWGIYDELPKLITSLYDEVYQHDDAESKACIDACIDIWDLMFEKQFGSMRLLSQQLIER